MSDVHPSCVSPYKMGAFFTDHGYRVVHEKVEHMYGRWDDWTVMETIGFDYCSEGWPCWTPDLFPVQRIISALKTTHDYHRKANRIRLPNNAIYMNATRPVNHKNN